MSNKSYFRGKMIRLRPEALRKWRGEMTQAELAAKAGVSRATINRIEQGHAQSVTFEVINKLARALSMDADVLVTFEK
jgi:transcriptional regulator with XRE-family HTH domain